jgi:hypothetical protein
MFLIVDPSIPFFSVSLSVCQGDHSTVAESEAKPADTD